MTLGWQARLSVALLAAVALLVAVTSCRPESESTTWAGSLPTSTPLAMRAVVITTATPIPTPVPVPPEPDWEGMVPADLFTRAPDFSGIYELSASQMRTVLGWSGWPVELHAEALSVSWCESRFRPAALGDGIEAVGLFQVHRNPWGSYTDSNPEGWRTDPIEAARAAYDVYLYDLARGNPPWWQWSCKPTQERNWPE